MTLSAWFKSNALQVNKRTIKLRGTESNFLLLQPRHDPNFLHFLISNHRLILWLSDRRRCICDSMKVLDLELGIVITTPVIVLFKIFQIKYHSLSEIALHIMIQRMIYVRNRKICIMMLPTWSKNECCIK